MKKNDSTIWQIMFLLTFCFLFSNSSRAKDPNTTLQNLMTAYNGESNAKVRYTAFAEKADAEGYGRVASLFRATARAEQSHLEREAAIIKELGGTPEANIVTPEVKSTKENLESAIKGETYESTEMYPKFLDKASEEKIKAAKTEFEYAKDAEAVHAKLFKNELENLSLKEPKKDFYVCPVCGNILEKIRIGFCPICGENLKNFVPVN
jgi:rubrerythrin